VHSLSDQRNLEVAVLLRPRHLFGSWIIYWAALVLATAWRPVLTYWRVTHQPNGHGSATFGYSGSLLMLGLLVFGVPLVMAAVWALLRRMNHEQQ
jgi:hypothetical protein